MRLGHALHGLRETLGMSIVPREELRQRRALGLLLVVALVFGGAFGLARSARSDSAAVSSEDRSTSGTALSIAQLGSDPALPALLVPKPSAPAPRPAAPATATTSTTITTTANLGGFTTGPPIPVNGPAPSAPAPTPAPSPAPAPAPATPSKPSGGSFDDSG
jgi:hypothetical protein